MIIHTSPNTHKLRIRPNNKLNTFFLCEIDVEPNTDYDVRYLLRTILTSETNSYKNIECYAEDIEKLIKLYSSNKGDNYDAEEVSLLSNNVSNSIITTEEKVNIHE